MSSYNFKYSNDYSMVNADKLSVLEPRIKDIDHKFRNKKGAGAHMTAWADTCDHLTDDIVNDINAFAKKWQGKIDTLVVCGIGGSYLGGRAINDLINQDQANMKIMWFGYSFSSDYIKRCLDQLRYENCSFGAIIISKSGTTLETVLGFRMLKDVLINKYDEKEAHNRLAFVTNLHEGTLHEYAQKHKIKVFNFPDDIGGRFSVITPCGLLPLAILGVDIKQFIKGYQIAEKLYKTKHGLDNDCYLYAATRYLLSEKYQNEILVMYNEDARYFTEWWKQLLAESEGKNEKGILTSATIFPFGLHSVGQFIQEGKKTFVETVIFAKNSKNSVKIPFDKEDLDGLNYLANVSYDDLNKIVFQGVLEAHGPIGHNPNLLITLDEINAESAGFLVHFFFLAIMMSCYLHGLNPFDQPGVEIYKKQVKSLLSEKYKK